MSNIVGSPKKVKKKKRTKEKRKALKSKGVIPLKLSEEAKEHFKLHDLIVGIPLKLIKKVQLLEYISEKEEYSDIVEKIKVIWFRSYKVTIDTFQNVDENAELLFYWDPLQEFGSSFSLIFSTAKIRRLKAEYDMVAEDLGITIDLNSSIEQSTGQTAVFDNKNAQIRRWSSLGSSLEVDSLINIESKSGIGVRLQRNTEDLHFPILTDAPTEYIEFRSENHSFEIHGVVERWTQTDVQFANSYTQTSWKLTKNKSTQYEYQILSPDQVQKCLQQPQLIEFIKSALILIEEAIEENAI